PKSLSEGILMADQQRRLCWQVGGFDLRKAWIHCRELGIGQVQIDRRLRQASRDHHHLARTMEGGEHLLEAIKLRPVVGGPVVSLEPWHPYFAFRTDINFMYDVIRGARPFPVAPASRSMISPGCMTSLPLSMAEIATGFCNVPDEVISIGKV